jgi:hypothetical protein
MLRSNRLRNSETRPRLQFSSNLEMFRQHRLENVESLQTHVLLERLELLEPNQSEKRYGTYTFSVIPEYRNVETISSNHHGGTEDTESKGLYDRSGGEESHAGYRKSAYSRQPAQYTACNGS